MSSASASLRGEAKSLARLAGPLIVAQGGITLMGAVDAFVIGQVSAMEMAAVSLGNSVVGMFSGLGIGIAMGIEPLVGQAYGANKPNGARSWLWQGLWVCLLASIPIALVAVGTSFLLESFGISDELSMRARDYLWPRLPGIPIILWCVASRAYLSNIGRPKAALYAAIWSNIFNLILDVLLVYGYFGIPKLGAAGIAWSTTLCFTLVLIIQCLDIRKIWNKALDGSEASIEAEGFLPKNARKIVKTGWPIGLHLLTEIGIFSAVSALIARFGEIQLAAHQIALSLASVSFMGAVGIANATTSRVGNYVGAGSSADARRAGFVGMFLGGSFMLVSGIGFMLGAEFLANAFTNDESVRPIATTLVRIAGVFALADGIQAVGAGALRGAGDTQWPFWASLVAYWLIGLPIGFLLSTDAEIGVAGYWWGLTLAMCLIAVILIFRFRRISSGNIRRLTLPPS